jgi:hypothetical protein
MLSSGGRRPAREGQECFALVHMWRAAPASPAAYILSRFLRGQTLSRTSRLESTCGGGRAIGEVHSIEREPLVPFAATQ